VLHGFDKLSPAKQKLLLRRLDERRKREEAIPRSPRRDEPEGGDARFPLSYAQRRLWFLAHLEPGHPAYHLSYALRLTGPLDVPALAAALAGVVHRHEALRTVFEITEGEPWQRVLPPAPLPFPLADLSALPASRRAAETFRLAEGEALHPFAVDRGPHLRATLLRLDATEHALFFTMHHLVSDGWSMGVLVREVGALYTGVAGLAPPTIQYPDYADWQRERLAGAELERLLGWWRQELAGLPGALDLPTDRPRPAVASGRGGLVHSVLSPGRIEALRAVRERDGDTLFMILLAAFTVLLRRMTGEEDLAVGTPVANRPRQELEPLIGFFVNTLVLRPAPPGAAPDDPTFRELLTRVREAALGAFSHQELPFEKLVEELRPARDLSRTPLFQVMLALQNAWERQTPDLPGLALEPLEHLGATAKFDLSLNAQEAPDGLGLTLEYATDLFDTATAWRLSGHYLTLLAAIAADPGRKISDLPLWTDVERHQVLVEWNDAREEGTDEPQTLHSLVAAQARRTPEAIALVHGEETLTYADLLRRAEELAERLRAAGAGPEQIVAVRLPRSAGLVVALLGVLQSGAAYLPLDPAYPEERIAFMVEDAGAGWLLGPPSPTLPREAGEGAPSHPGLPEESSFKLTSGRAVAPSPASRGRVGEGGLAYLIYTSGSTGRPKGVAIEHRSAAALVRWARTVFSPAELSGVLASTSVCFDLSVFEIFVPLATGGRVIVVEDVLGLRALPAEAGVTLVNTVPSALDALLRTGGLPASVRTVNLAGEPIPRDLVERVARLPGIRLLNLYGPSEDTTYSTWAEIANDDRPAPIGRPVAGTRAHLVDRIEGSQPAPVGAPGHLLLGGRGLARGYFRRPDLTAERFVPDPFHQVDGWLPGDRLYRTGDLARRRADGALEFLGRIDQQVKVRGFRIEPGEIEAALVAHPGVREATVGIWISPSGDRRLVAWVAGDVSAADLRPRLAAKLPAPLVPAHLVMLEALPRTANGKLDRRALPPPEPPAPASAAAPASATEQAVAAIWREVLGVERVGLHDNFFDLGGHSLLLVRVHDRLCRELGADLPLVDLFRHPDVASLARRLRREAQESSAPAVVPPNKAREDRDVAVIGMAGRFPGAPDLATFWQNLREGVESITFFSRAELLAAGVPADQADDPAHVPARGHLDGIDLFDAAFFDMSPREAAFTDPQHRLFLECCAAALEHAGQDPPRQGQRAGVWAGMAFSTYAVANLLSHAGRPEAPGGLELLAGNDKDYLATRVSYKLDLRGPAMTVQTACSSSLVAVHLACRSLLEGECEIALAGGVSVHLPQKTGYLWQEGGILSPDGHCRSFDATARGTVGGDGVGVIVLKPLAAALADGDPVHAVIRGSALANDGAGKVGFTAPSVEGQARAIAQAQAAAGIEPATIGLIEAHGSATPLGDPIEAAALHQVFGAGAGPHTCALGSVKSNIGHLDAAAGIAGLLKAVLAVEHGEIPPSLHFAAPNPQIDFAAGPFYVSTGLHPWPAGRTPRRAGVSSFGLGGTNAHVILEEAPAREPDPDTARPWQLLVLSARTETALEAATDRLAAHLQELPDLPLAGTAWTLQAGRRAHEHRRALVVRSGEDAARALAMRDPRRLLTGATTSGARPVAFVFPGLGEQYGGMGASLYREEPVFRDAFDRCATLLQPRLGRDLRELLGFEGKDPGEEDASAGAPDLRRMLRRGAPAERADRELLRTAVAQPAVFALEYALAALWLSWGCRPQAVIGYSLGEYVAACVAGVLTLEDALTLVAERARWIEELPAGAMLAVGLTPEEIEPLLGEALSLAAVNGPRLSVVAGPPTAIADLESRLTARGDAFRPVETTHAFHSQMMRPLAGRLEELVRTFERRPPQIPCLSNVTGTWLTAADALDPAYWSRHLCGPVLFAAGLGELWQEPGRILVEVGPGGSLTSMALQHLATVRQANVNPEATGDHLAVRSLPSLHEHRPGRSDRAYLLHSLAKLWIAGVEVDWTGLHAGETRRKVELPAYPFERQRFWVEALPPERSGPPQPEPAPRGQERAPAGRPGAPRRLARSARPAERRGPRAPLLPETAVPGHARPNLRNAFVAPEGEIERSLADLWQRLLGIAAVGRHDSFFEMGGHSLLATRLMNDVRMRWGVALPMASLFENPTVAELAGVVARRRREGDLGVPAGVVLPEIVPDPGHRFEPFPLTDIQQAYWLGRSAAFEMGNIGSYIYQETDLTGLDLGRLESALRRTIDRHDMLRAVFLPDGRQRVLPEVAPYQIPVFDLTGLAPEAREEALLALRREMSHQVFDVTRWPLFDLRAARLDGRLDGGRVRLFFGIDVLIGDGWSFTVLFRDLARFYSFPETDPEPLTVSFRDYVVAEAALHTSEAYERSLRYWLERLADLPGAPELPMAKSPAALMQPRFSRRTGRLDAPSWKRLKERGARAGLTPSGLLLAAFSEILAAWSGSPRFTLTLTLFNRPPVHPQIHDLIGDFTSLTLLAVDASVTGGFEAGARAVQERLWLDLEHRAVSGVRVLRELARVQGRQVALPVIFTSGLGLHQDEDQEENADDGALTGPEDADLRAEPVWGVSQTPQVWIDHQAGEHGGELTFNWDVVDELFPAGMIDAMWSAYRDLLRRLADDDAAWTAERRRLIPAAQLARRVQANSTGAPLVHERLHTLFAAQAQKSPDRPAVLAPSRTLTYGELAALANRLGRHLRELGAKPNTLVAVVQEKGWEQIVSVLGILASGAAYLPLDPTLPRERLRALLERAEATLAVTTPDLDASLDWPETVRRVVIDAEGTGLPTEDSPLDPVQRTTDLAYVIFTSGSTGTPKGVMIDHRGAVNTILDVNRTWNVGPDDRVLALSSLSFDLSVWDVFGLLAAGGAIVLPRAEAEREPLHWLERLHGENVTIWNSVPALLRMLVDVLETAPAGSFESPLRLALLSGDWIPLDLPDRIRALSPRTQLVSLGGATEASIWSIAHPIGRIDPAWKSIPYGRPLANQSFHVLDGRLELCPDHVPGHLYIGGIGLAKGYWRDPEKTAASFLTHAETGERLYRTGDLGRALPDGTLEILGREDFQVKIQGYRIELGEIEAALADHPGVRAAVATATGDRMGTRRLVAYVVPATAWEGLAGTLRDHLRARLPEYMIPALFVPLDTIPLGPTGKIDRRTLPDPEAVLGQGTHQPPQTETETALAAIWAEVLRRPEDRIGRSVSFFELGGDSLLATQIMARVHEVFRTDLPLRTFFDALTLETQATAIDQARPPQGDSDEEKLTRLLDQLQDASPEEVERMLAELRGAG